LLIVSIPRAILTPTKELSVSFMIDGKVQLKCVPAVKRMDVNKRKVIVMIAEWQRVWNQGRVDSIKHFSI